MGRFTQIVCCLATVVVVLPEPSTLVLLGVGAISLLACGWRRRKRGSGSRPLNVVEVT